MNALQSFTYETNNLRSVLDEHGEPWFVGKDICSVLGLSNHKDALGRLDDDERKGVAITDPLGKNPQTMTIISEAGVYRLIFTSRVESSEKFKRWLAHEVLPTLRKAGSYSINPPSQQLNQFEEYREALKTAEAIGLRGNQSILAANNLVRNLHGKNMLALMGITHLVSENQVRHFTPTELGQRKKISGQKFNQLLEAVGFQVRMGNIWVPTEAGREFAVLMDTGKKHNGGTPVQQLKWLESVMERI